VPVGGKFSGGRQVDKLQRQIAQIKKRRDHDFDNIWVYDSGGGRGTGKSVAGLWSMVYYYEGKIQLDNVIFNGMELLERYSEGDLGECVIYDEAIRDLYKREAMTIINIVLVKLLDLGRWRKIFLIVILPNFWALDPDVRNIVDVRGYIYNKGLERGFTIFYKGQRSPWTRAEPYLDRRFTYKFRDFPKGAYSRYKRKKVKAYKKSVQDFKKILERRMGTGKSKRKQILEELYTNPNASSSAIARKVGTSESYVGRIKREAGLT